MSEENELPPLEHTAWVLSKIDDFINGGGGTFRYLIYETMGYGPEAYQPLYAAGGMNLTNFICNADEAEEIFNGLMRLCEALLAYRNRCGSLGFQLEKLDDHLHAIREAISKAKDDLA